MYYDYCDICDAETRHLNGSCQSGIPLRLDLHLDAIAEEENLSTHALVARIIEAYVSTYYEQYGLTVRERCERRIADIREQLYGPALTPAAPAPR